MLVVPPRNGGAARDRKWCNAQHHRRLRGPRLGEVGPGPRGHRVRLVGAGLVAAGIGVVFATGLWTTMQGKLNSLFTAA